MLTNFVFFSFQSLSKHKPRSHLGDPRPKSRSFQPRAAEDAPDGTGAAAASGAAGPVPPKHPSPVDDRYFAPEPEVEEVDGRQSSPMM